MSLGRFTFDSFSDYPDRMGNSIELKPMKRKSIHGKPILQSTKLSPGNLMSAYQKINSKYSKMISLI